MLAAAGRSDDRAQRARHTPLAADHLAAILGSDVEPEHVRVVVVDPLDTDRVRLVDEPAREVLEQLDQESSFAFSSRATAFVGCAPLSSHARTFSSSNSIRDGSSCGL